MLYVDMYKFRNRNEDEVKTEKTQWETHEKSWE